MRIPGRFVLLVAIALFYAAVAAAQTTKTKTRNVIFVMTDGLRWQEVFSGADAALMNKENGKVVDVNGLKQDFWRDKSRARREALMPFLWSVIAKQGQIYGNRELKSDAYVTNALNFSYPGYNETLCGFPDPRINSNDKNPNPNVTVFEWLHNKPAYKGKVAAFSAWDVFPFIFNAKRAGFPVNAGHDPLTLKTMTPRLELLNRLKIETWIWSSEAFDSLTFHTTLEYLKQNKPRVLFLSLGETDEWAHEGQYAEYLRAARRVDQYLKELWDIVQSMPEYRDTTTLIFSPDHGRGESPVEWKSHGAKIPDSKYIWMAFLGPDTRPLGERSQIPAMTQSQIAATLAAFLGEDYVGDVPKAGKPIADVLAH
jgi:predicted AlkP superfamily pyrophosphatase or phosphodiesterase